MSLYHLIIKLFLKLNYVLPFKFFTRKFTESDGRISSSADSPPFPSERKINTLTSDGSLARMSFHEKSENMIEDESSSVSPLLHLVCDALGKSSMNDELSTAPKDELLYDPFTTDIINDDNFIVHKVLINGNDLLDNNSPGTNNLMINRSSFEEREENLLSTVIEEEHEQDSLEEFIKHETECGCQSSATTSANAYGEKGESCCNSVKGPENENHKRCTAFNQLAQQNVEGKCEINDGQEKEKQFGRSDDSYVCTNGGSKKCDLLQYHDQLMASEKEEKVNGKEEKLSLTFFLTFSFLPRHCNRKSSLEWTSIIRNCFFALVSIQHQWRSG